MQINLENLPAGFVPSELDQEAYLEFIRDMLMENSDGDYEIVDVVYPSEGRRNLQNNLDQYLQNSGANGFATQGNNDNVMTGVRDDEHTMGVYFNFDNVRAQYELSQQHRNNFVTYLKQIVKQQLTPGWDLVNLSYATGAYRDESISTL